jgi:predicted O-methyltransferase YrrM
MAQRTIRTMNKIVRASARRVLVIGESAARPAEDALAPDGKLILIETDPARAEQARARLLQSGLDRRATVISGDPRRMLHKLAGPFDIIFCDEAHGSLRDKLTMLLAPDGVLITQ